MKVLLSSENDTKAWGEKIGAQLRGGDCIELVGDVGSGKTTLTKGIARGLGIDETIQSPTFTINRTYDSPSGLRLSHYDFYRLNDPGIMSEELAESLSEPDVIVIIEWGDIVTSVLPKSHIRITFSSPTETDREVVIEGEDEVIKRITGVDE